MEVAEQTPSARMISGRRRPDQKRLVHAGHQKPGVARAGPIDPAMRSGKTTAAATDRSRRRQHGRTLLLQTGNEPAFPVACQSMFATASLREGRTMKVPEQSFVSFMCDHLAPVERETYRRLGKRR